MIRCLLTSLILFSAVHLSGCALFRNIEEPKVSLDNVSLKDVTGSGATVIFGLKVDNPNPFALRVQALDYNVEIGGKPFSQGLIDEPTEVAANASSVVNVPVPVKYADLFSSALDLIKAGKQPYRIYGKAKVSYLNIPFSHTGDLEL